VVDVSFDNTGVPGEGEPGDDGVEIAFEVEATLRRLGRSSSWTAAIQAGSRSPCR
jgi:hypothetical protein